jgi:mono/diheme cytochrome c family protein
VSVVVVMVGLAVSATWLTGLTLRNAQAQKLSASPPKTGDHGHALEDHVHAAVPAAYANAHIPTGIWTDPKMIAKGKEVFTAKCALCHGEKGDGKGPGAANLPAERLAPGTGRVPPGER